MFPCVLGLTDPCAGSAPRPATDPTQCVAVPPLWAVCVHPTTLCAVCVTCVLRYQIYIHAAPLENNTLKTPSDVYGRSTGDG